MDSLASGAGNDGIFLDRVAFSWNISSKKNLHQIIRYFFKNVPNHRGEKLKSVFKNVFGIVCNDNFEN